MIQVRIREEIEVFVHFKALNHAAPLVTSHYGSVTLPILNDHLSATPRQSDHERLTSAVWCLVHLDRVVLIVLVVAAYDIHEGNLPLVALQILTHIVGERTALVHYHVPVAAPVYFPAFREGVQLGVVWHTHRRNPVLPGTAATDDVCRLGREPINVVVLVWL